MDLSHLGATFKYKGNTGKCLITKVKVRMEKNNGENPKGNKEIWQLIQEQVLQ